MLEKADLVVNEMNKQILESENKINEIKNVIKDRQEEKNKRVGIYGPNTDIENRELDEEISAKTKELQEAENEKSVLTQEVNTFKSEFIQKYEENETKIAKLTQSNLDLNKELESLKTEKLNDNSGYIKQELLNDIKKIKDEIDRNNKLLQDLSISQKVIKAWVNNRVNFFGLDRVQKDETAKKEEEASEKEDKIEKVEKASEKDKATEKSEEPEKDDELTQIKNELEGYREQYNELRENANKYRKNGDEEAALKEEEKAENILIKIDELKKKKKELQEKAIEAENEKKQSEQDAAEATKVAMPTVKMNNSEQVNSNVAQNNANKKRDIKAILNKVKIFFIDTWHVVKKKAMQLGKTVKTKLFPENNVKAIGASSVTQNEGTAKKNESDFKDRIKVEDNAEQAKQTGDVEKANSEKVVRGNNYEDIKDILDMLEK